MLIHIVTLHEVLVLTRVFRSPLCRRTSRTCYAKIHKSHVEKIQPLE
jgi:hypothetical protein